MRKKSRFITLDDVKFVYENYSHMSASQIAEKIGITKFQVNKIVTELRKRGVNIPRKLVKRKNIFDIFVKEIKSKEKK